MNLKPIRMARSVILPVVVLVAGFILHGSNAEDKSINLPDYDFHAKVMGKSGSVVIGRNPNPQAGADGMKFNLVKLQEMNAQGEAIANTGQLQKRHGFPNFSTQDFTFNGPEEAVLFGLETVNLNFSSSLTIDGTDVSFLVEIHVFQESGNITIDGETTPVLEGDVKLNILVDNWPFCEGENQQPCGGETGAYLDFEIEVKGKQTPEKAPSDWPHHPRGGKGPKALRALRMKPDRPERFDFSDEEDGQAFFLSTRVKVDGDWDVMADGYPKQDTQKKDRFVLRFPKFTSSLFYDPVMSLGVDDSGSDGTDGTDGGDDGGSSGAASVSLAAAAVLPAFIGAMLLKR